VIKKAVVLGNLVMQLGTFENANEKEKVCINVTTKKVQQVIHANACEE